MKQFRTSIHTSNFGIFDSRNSDWDYNILVISCGDEHNTNTTSTAEDDSVKWIQIACCANTHTTVALTKTKGEDFTWGRNCFGQLVYGSDKISRRHPTTKVEALMDSSLLSKSHEAKSSRLPLQTKGKR